MRKRTNPIMRELTRIRIDLEVLKKEVKINRWLIGIILVTLLSLLAKAFLG